MCPRLRRKRPARGLDSHESRAPPIHKASSLRTRRGSERQLVVIGNDPVAATFENASQLKGIDRR